MNNTGQPKKDSDGRKIFGALIMVLTLMLCTTSATYAYFAIAPVSNSSATGTAATASMSLEVTKITPNTTKWNASTKKMVPQKEKKADNSELLATAMNDTNSCVDANNNVVCEVFQIKVTNGSTSQVRVNGTLTFTLSPNNTGHNFKYRLKDNGSSTLTTANAATQLGSATTAAIANGTAISLASKKLLAVNTSYYYYFVVWINETGADQSSKDAGVTFTGAVNFNAVDASGASIGGITSTITG